MPHSYVSAGGLAPPGDRLLFATVASERAKQLLRGARVRLSTPVGVSHKPIVAAMREVRFGLVPYRVFSAATTSKPEGLAIYQANDTIEATQARISGPTIVVRQPDLIAGLRVAYDLARRSSAQPLEVLRRALQEENFDLFTWSSWADAGASVAGAEFVGPAMPAHAWHIDDAFEESLDFALGLAEASWRSKHSDDPVSLALTIPNSPDRAVSIDAPAGALVMHPGSLVTTLAFKYKKPVGFALAFLRNRGVMPSQLAESIHRSLREAARRQPDVADLTSLMEMDAPSLRGKSGLVVFIHGLISTDIGLFDSLVRRLRRAMPDVHLAGFPHNTFAAIETNALVLADWLKKIVPGADVPIVFICHSRGGLVARSTAVELYERDKAWKKRLRGCVTFGTPHEGAAFAEVAEQFFPTFASLATLNGTRNVLSSIDVLTYFGAGGKFDGIEDLRPLAGGGSTRDRFLKSLREREGRAGRIDILAFGGKVPLAGPAAKLVRRFLAGTDSDQVVELTSSTPALFSSHQCVVTTCSHFEYFRVTKQNQPHLSRALQYVWRALGGRDVKRLAG